MQNSKKAVVVGGGYIGLEVALNLMQNKGDVTIVDLLKILNTQTKSFTDILTEGAKHNP